MVCVITLHAVVTLTLQGDSLSLADFEEEAILGRHAWQVTEVPSLIVCRVMNVVLNFVV